MKRKIYVSGDHAGFKLKEILKKFLLKKGFVVEDLGPFEYNKNDDYPDFVIPMAKKVAKNKIRGIVFAGSGMGESIASNRIKGVRAGLYHGGKMKIVRTARAHDNINVLCLGSRFVSLDEAKKAINIFLKEDFAGGRHARRLKKIEK